MPIYELECPKCKRVYELICTFEETEHLACDYCWAKLVRLISPGSFIIDKATENA